MPLPDQIVRSIQDTSKEQSHGVSGSFLGKYYTRLLIGTYERPKPFASPTFKNTAAVFLPLPNELRDDTSVGYTNVNLETVGDVINGAFGGGGGTRAALLRKSGDMVSTALGIGGDLLAAGAGALAGNAAEKIVGAGADIVGSLFPAEQITSAIQQSFGLAPNPNPSVMFQGPVLRDFSYTWAFYPKSEDESRAIDKLIKLLKSKALPKNYIANKAAILKYPDMCQLNFFPWDENGSGDWFWSGNSIIRYKKCVMQGVNANYNPFGTPAFFEGTNLPVSYQLTISFKEIEYMLSDDWVGVMTAEGTEEAFDKMKASVVQTAGSGAIKPAMSDLTAQLVN